MGADDVGYSPSIVVPTGQSPVIAYVNKGTREVILLNCIAATCATGGSKRAVPGPDIDNGGNGNGTLAELDHLAMALGSDGLPVIATYGSRRSGRLGLDVIHCGDLTCDPTLLGFSRTRVVGANDAGKWPAIAIGNDGKPLVMYTRGSGIGEVHVVHCGTVKCDSSNTDTVVYSNATIGPNFSAIAVDSGGIATAIFLVNHALLAVRAADNVFSQVASIATIADIALGTPGGVYQGKINLMFGSDGKPVANYKIDGGGFMLVQGGNSSFTAGNVYNSIDGGAAGLNNTGLFAGLVKGFDGFPVNTYYDPTLNSLKLAKCGSVNCAFEAGNEVGANATIVDGTAPLKNVGLYNSVAVNAAHFPIIAYYDAMNHSLQVASCTSSNCAS